nr:eukaryotic translation initiation factor 4B3 [Arachis hypogaea]
MTWPPTRSPTQKLRLGHSFTLINESSSHPLVTLINGYPGRAHMPAVTSTTLAAPLASPSPRLLVAVTSILTVSSVISLSSASSSPLRASVIVSPPLSFHRSPAIFLFFLTTTNNAITALKLLREKKNKFEEVPLFQLCSFVPAGAFTFSLAEFTAAKTDYQDPIVLPTGPRQRTAEELDRDRNRLGSGFRNYGDDRANRSFGDGDDSSNSRWGSSRVSDKPRQNGGFRDSNRELAPSRADEIDNWAAAKKSTVGNGFKRRERDRDIERSGFFDSQLRADESDSWVTNKSYVPSESRRFGSNGGFGGLGFERERKVGFGSSGGEDSDNWNKKKVEFNGESERSEGGGGRPRLVLQPRTTPVNNESQEGVFLFLPTYVLLPILPLPPS